MTLKNNFVKQHDNIIDRIVFLILIIGSFMPRIVNFGTGLDNSGLYAVNYFWNSGVIFGRDVFYSYGPLGFLCYTMNVGHNIILSLLFWGMITLFFAILWYQILFKKNSLCRWQIGLAVILSVMVECYASQEYFLYYIFFLAFLCGEYINEKNIYICDVLISFIVFIKFSALMGILSGVIMAIILKFIYKDNNNRLFLKHFVGSFLVAFLLLLLYTKSFKVLANYIKGGLEVSSGYGSGMSLCTSYETYLLWAIVIVLFYMVELILCLIEKKYNNFRLLCVFAGPLFMMYKHGFVRADAHVFISFQGLIVVLSFLFLFADFRREKYGNKFIVILSAMAIMCILINNVNISTVISTIKNRTVDLPSQLVSIVNEDIGNQNVLPQEITTRIGQDSATIYPWNILYRVNADFEYRPMPAVQNYCAYTPYLDMKDAEFFRGENAPKYIILSLETIDGRWSMIETPQTWWEINKNYYVDYCENDILLLKQRDGNREISLKNKEKYSISKDEQINVKNKYVKVDAELSMLGKIAKLFWKIPEVDMNVEYTSGKSETHRILLDNLSAGVDLSSIVYDTNSFVDYVNFEGKLSKVKSISFSGVGLKFYKDKLEITTYDENYKNKECINSIQLYASEVCLDNEEKALGGVRFCTDSLLRNDEVTEIKGWAFLVDGNNKNTDVYIYSQGKFYLANKEERSDVSDVYGVDDTNIGFDICIPNKVDMYQIYIKKNDKLYKTEVIK